MILHRTAHLASRWTALLLLLSGLVPGAIAPAQAQRQRTRRSPVTFVMPRLSYDRGAPGKRSEGASRTSFCGLPEGPVALTPQYSEPGRSSSDQLGHLAQEQHYVLTKTSQAQPTFALHMPLAAQDVADLELTLVVEDLAGNLVYELPIPTPSQAGILTFQPAPSEAPLALGQRYNWAVMITVACEAADRAVPDYSWVGGQIERQAPAPTSLVGLRGEELAQAYAGQGFWHEAMATVAELHRQAPGDEQYRADWTALLDSIGLADLAAAPLVDCTQLLTAER